MCHKSKQTKAKKKATKSNKHYLVKDSTETCRYRYNYTTIPGVKLYSLQLFWFSFSFHIHDDWNFLLLTLKIKTSVQIFCQFSLCTHTHTHTHTHMSYFSSKSKIPRFLVEIKTSIIIHYLLPNSATLKLNNLNQKCSNLEKKLHKYA